MKKFMSRHNWKSNPNCPRQSDMGINLIIVIQFINSKFTFECETLDSGLHLHKNILYQYTRDDIMRLGELAWIEIFFCYYRQKFLPFIYLFFLATFFGWIIVDQMQSEDKENENERTVGYRFSDWWQIQWFDDNDFVTLFINFISILFVHLL